MVKIRELLNKPLVEAILELRWHIDPEIGDPNYSIFVGGIYSILKTKYKFHEPLPSSMIPERIAGSFVQHRFRIEKNKWPLIQVGPGIVTLNDTTNYTWTDFGQRANELVKAMFKAYPKPEEMRISNLVLRYIDAIQMSDARKNVLDFTRKNLKANFIVPEQLYDGVDVIKKPKSFSFQIANITKNPKGTVTLRFATGMHKGRKAIILETVVQSINEELPSLPDGFSAWIKAAHNITDDWFFKLIEGDLESEFAGE